MRRLLTTAVLALSTFPAFAQVPNVVASTKPVHSLVAAVMGDLGTPELIVKGSASPHTYSLRPSDAASLEAAGIVFWTGHGMELFLEGALETLAPTATTVALSEDPAITLLPVREGGAFEPHDDGDGAEHAHEHGDEHDDAHDHEHDDEHDHEQHEHGELDMHFWLDPVNAIAMVTRIAEALTYADPGHSSIYLENSRAEIDRLQQLIVTTEALLAPQKHKGFVVFHDAYQYFERRFDLNAVGSVTVTPDTLPGAQRISTLRDKVKETGAACVFAEPQFEPAVVDTIIGGTFAKAGVLDPEGSGLEPGPQLYEQLITGLAQSLVDCLSQTAP